MEATNIAAKSSSGSLVSSRSDARILIAEKWANRRKLQNKNQQHGELDRGSNSSNDVRGLGKDNTRPLFTPENGPVKIPPLCVLLRRSWNQAINGLIQIQQQQNIKQTTERGPSLPQQQQQQQTSVKYENNRRVSFPSVLSVLKANAVKLQIETMMLAEEDEKNGDIDDGFGNINANGLSVLPSSCNDFTTSAVNHMSDSRSRAFLLLDFSAIVQTHTVWRKRLAILKNHKDVQIVYSARRNCNARLLQLLQRLGVGLRVATKYDLAAVREATLDNQNEVNRAIIWDDASVLVKPNSFYRNLLLNKHDRINDEGEDEDLATPKRIIPITVGNAEEMERIHKQLHTICKRRRQSIMPKLEFVLKLDNVVADDFEEWKTIFGDVHEKASKMPDTEVVGVALELGGEDTGDTGDSTSEKKNNMVLLNALSGLIQDWTQLSPLCPQVHLTNPVTATEIESGVIEWIEEHRKICNGITIDASRLLMANAAALCTRIIGVKNNDGNERKSGDSESSSSCSSKNSSENLDEDRDGDSNGATNLIVGIQQQKNGSNTIQQHLYIDDGCYGSLSNYPNEGIPLPLKSQRIMRSLSATSKQLLEIEQKTLVNTTVWGPTCKCIEPIESESIPGFQDINNGFVMKIVFVCHSLLL